MAKCIRLRYRRIRNRTVADQPSTAFLFPTTLALIPDYKRYKTVYTSAPGFSGLGACPRKDTQRVRANEGNLAVMREPPIPHRR
jgi:hypothetical protein